MIALKKIFKRRTLNSEGTELSRIVTDRLLNSNLVICVDFADIDKATPVFFQDFLFPLILEFGSETITKRIDLINLSDDINFSYQESLLRSSEYLDRADTLKTKAFGDISDITFELLIKARELSRRDSSAAHIIFGLSSTMIESLANMDIEQMQRISYSGLICFEPRFTPEFASKLAAFNTSEIDTFLNVIGSIDMEGVYDSEYY